MANNQFINLEELSKTTQALLSKINEQSNLKVNKSNVEAIITEGTKIADIEGVELYAPEVDLSNYPTYNNLAVVAISGRYNDLSNKPTLATVATSGSYNDLNDKPDIPNVPSWALTENKPTYTASEVGAVPANSQHLLNGSSSAIINSYITASFSAYDDDSGNSTSFKAATRAGYIELKINDNAIKITPTTTIIRNIITPTADKDAANKKYVDDSIVTAIGNINQFEVAIVTDLPDEKIKTHTIYFKSNSSSGNNVYDEYMYINNNWELIGSTQIDLTPYALSANLATVATSGSYNDLSNTPNLATVATSGDYDDLTDAPVAETDANVEDMLDNFDLDYTSNSISANIWQGGSF